MEQLYKIKPLDWIECLNQESYLAYSASETYCVFLNSEKKWILRIEDDTYAVCNSKEEGMNMADQMYLEEVTENLIKV